MNGNAYSKENIKIFHLKNGGQTHPSKEHKREKVFLSKTGFFMVYLKNFQLLIYCLEMALGGW